MKVQIPNELKADMPQTTFGKILSATPVVMAVVATMLAGLASSEMTRAQYDRSLGAQQQSKAGDQWSFFQAKRLRGAYQQNTAELLETLSEVHPLEPAVLKQWAQGKPELLALLDSPVGQRAVQMLRQGEVPKLAAGPAPAAPVKTALDALDSMKSDAEMAVLLAPVSTQVVDQTLRDARDQADAFDAATKPYNRVIDQFSTLLTKQAVRPAGSAPAVADSASNPGLSSLNRDFTAARLRYTAQRYEVEARLNQAIANLYELQVRKSNFSAERHHARSKRFFFGMLAAQLGVIISTFAIAARKRNLLWALAAGAGVIAIAFAIYVYLYV
jgi:hypothetical protein